MTIVYRTTGAWGAGSGANLTPAQVDGNFYDLDQRIENLEDNPPVANGIASITQSGSQITVHLDDSTTQGPFTLPTNTMTWRGDWTALYLYNVNDLVTVDGFGLYLVLQDHTSDASFDPNATNTDGDLYLLVFGIDTPVVDTVTGASYTIELADNGNTKVMTNSGGCVVTVPKDSDEDFAVGMTVKFYQLGSGAVSFVDDGDTAEPVVLSYRASRLPQTVEQYAWCCLEKIDDNYWVLWGELAHADEVTF